tara:strand:+ start:295 stop:465 length:171 start_codon:yes stop_codon:yes gene_type:complete
MHCIFLLLTTPSIQLIERILLKIPIITKPNDDDDDDNDGGDDIDNVDDVDNVDCFP